MTNNEKFLKGLAIYQIIGGAWGIFFVFVWGSNLIFNVAIVFILSVYSLPIWGGINLIKKSKNRFILMKICLWLQILYFSGPALKYQFLTGFGFYIGYFVGGTLFYFQLTTALYFQMNKQLPFEFAINIVPIILLVYLHKEIKKVETSKIDAESIYYET